MAVGMNVFQSFRNYGGLEASLNSGSTVPKSWLHGSPSSRHVIQLLHETAAVKR
jgi:hypothetical protein